MSGELREQGRTHLRTRRQKRWLIVVALVLFLGAGLAVWVGAAAGSLFGGGEAGWPQLHWHSPVVTGDGGLLGRRGGQPTHLQVPLTVTWPVVALPAALAVGAVFLVGWLRLVVTPLHRRSARPVQWSGLASRTDMLDAFGARAARKAGTYTLPGRTRWQRWALPQTWFGFRIGSGIRPERTPQLWADWEARIRVIARTGWGKSARLLIPIIRELPGPAVISSSEPGIFTSTVLARSTRLPPVRWPILRRLSKDLRTPRAYPVAVADFTSPDDRWAAGFPALHWNLIPECVDYAVATRRAVGLITGADDSSRGSSEDDFFRRSATGVLGAWLHAAALSGRDVDDTLVRWLRDPTDTEPRTLLEDAGAGTDAMAALELDIHLDGDAAETTSGVRRYLALAITALAGSDARNMLTGGPSLDLEQFILAGGTVYLLADEARLARVRPLLSLFADEMFVAAERAARRCRSRRLPLPFVGIFDELQWGVTPSRLPYAATAQRKYGVAVVYCCQSAAQEEIIYGRLGAESLRGAGLVTIRGGIDDVTSARDVAERAGHAPVVEAGRNSGGGSEHVVERSVLTVADQQRLRKGEGVVVRDGMAPFIITTPLYYDDRGLRRQIEREERSVARTVAASLAGAAAVAAIDDQAVEVGSPDVVSLTKELPVVPAHPPAFTEAETVHDAGEPVNPWWNDERSAPTASPASENPWLAYADATPTPNQQEENPWWR